MSNFKIIAIKPLPSCSKQYSKNLELGRPYYFYNNYIISARKIVESNNNVPANLYELANGLKVNISAIAGKNGSGKSTIVELLYAAIFMAAWKFKILPKVDDDGEKIHPIEELFVAVYFQKGQNYYCLNCKGRRVELLQQKRKNNFFQTLPKGRSSIKSEIRSLFYTIAVNYSQYALNSSHQNAWLKYLFHKNDGYQTPLVLNPFRKDGIIDINNEEYLTFSRILANLLTIRKFNQPVFNELAPGKLATDMRFVLDERKTNFKEEEKQLAAVWEKFHSEILHVIFSTLDISDDELSTKRPDRYLSAAYIYLFRKLYSITQRYKPYMKKEFQFLELSQPISDKIHRTELPELSIDRLRNLVGEIKRKPSHITFKFQQAINFIDNIRFYRPYIGKLIDIQEFAKALNKLKNSGKENLITLIPPSFFTVDIKFAENGWLRALSSGEKQTIYSSASWMYHILNLNSVREDRRANYIKYDCINLIFDEIELYYHPEMQRKLVGNFLENLSRITVSKNYGINCIFITHSPFILSDISEQNILFLTEKGAPDALAKDKRTFGANIHELLRDNFFLNMGTVGMVAQQKIDSVIKFLEGKAKISKEWNRHSANLFINIVSEPLIRHSLRDLYDQKFNPTQSEIQKQIELLQQDLRKIKQKKL